MYTCLPNELIYTFPMKNYLSQKRKIKNNKSEKVLIEIINSYSKDIASNVSEFKNVRANYERLSSI